MCLCCNFQDNKCALGTFFPTAAGLKERILASSAGQVLEGTGSTMAFVIYPAASQQPPNTWAVKLSILCVVCRQSVLTYYEWESCSKASSAWGEECMWKRRFPTAEIPAGQGQGEMLWCIITPCSWWVDMVCAFLECIAHKIPGVYVPSLCWEMPHRTVLP